MHITSDAGGSDDGTDRETASDSSDTEARTLTGTTAWDESHTWYTPPRIPVIPTINTAGYFTSAGANPRPRLDVIEDDFPLLGHRVAYLRFGGDTRHWQSVTADHAFGADEDAECKSAFGFAAVTFTEAQKHPVPSPDCTCGFYAYPLGVTGDFTGYPNTVTLLVELSGDVIECARMFRAGHQRVLECQLPRCPYCARESALLRARNGRLAAVACSQRHLEGGKGITVTVDDLAELIGVPVTSRPYT